MEIAEENVKDKRWEEYEYKINYDRPNLHVEKLWACVG